MLKFAHMTLTVMPGLVPGIHALLGDKGGVDGGTSPAMTNVGFWRNEPEIANSFNGTWPAMRSNRRHRDV